MQRLRIQPSGYSIFLLLLSLEMVGYIRQKCCCSVTVRLRQREYVPQKAKCSGTTTAHLHSQRAGDLSLEPITIASTRTARSQPSSQLSEDCTGIAKTRRDWCSSRREGPSILISTNSTTQQWGGGTHDFVREVINERHLFSFLFF